MFTVADVEADVKRVLGGCDDETFYSRLNHAVEILATMSEWNPLLGYVDVCVGSDRYVTLPREVGTVLAVTIDGTPAQAHDFWFKYHLNGPGTTFSSVGYHWIDGLPVASYLDPVPAGTTLFCDLETAADNGKAFRVFGYDVNGNWIRSLEGGSYVDGFLVPTVFGAETVNSSAPLIRRITRISKATTAGTIGLYAQVDGTATQIGQYFPTDTEPTYRRIQVSQPCSWVRVAFRKDVLKLTSPSDLIPLHSQYAIVLMAKSLKKMDEDRIEDAVKYQALAVEFLSKKQHSIDVPSGPSIQMATSALIADRSDRMS
jgi:hypothetical protein